MPEDATPSAAEGGRIAFSGELTIRNAEQMHTRLLDAVHRCPAVTVDCAAATDIDISFIQLVLAARKSAEAAGKVLSIAPASADRLAVAMRRAGLAEGETSAYSPLWSN